MQDFDDGENKYLEGCCCKEVVAYREYPSFCSCCPDTSYYDFWQLWFALSNISPKPLLMAKGPCFYG